MARTGVFVVVLALTFGLTTIGAAGQQPAAPIDPSPADYVLLTIFLKHDQSKTLDEINAILEQTGFQAKFPPEGIDIQSWYVMMGIGQVVTLRVPPARLREVNRAVEQMAWKAFRTEFYATYDLLPAVKARLDRARKK